MVRVLTWAYEPGLRIVHQGSFKKSEAGKILVGCQNDYVFSIYGITRLGPLEFFGKSRFQQIFTQLNKQIGPRVHFTCRRLIMWTSTTTILKVMIDLRIHTKIPISYECGECCLLGKLDLTQRSQIAHNKFAMGTGLQWK